MVVGGYTMTFDERAISLGDTVMVRYAGQTSYGKVIAFDFRLGSMTIQANGEEREVFEGGRVFAHRVALRGEQRLKDCGHRVLPGKAAGASQGHPR